MICPVLHKATCTRFELYGNLCRNVVPAHYVTSSGIVMVANCTEVCGSRISKMVWKVLVLCGFGMCELINCLIWEVLVLCGYWNV